MQHKNYCLNSNQISDCNGNESKICSTEDGDTSEEGGCSDASTCDLEMDANERVNIPVMSIVDADMMGNGLSTGKSKINDSSTFDKQLTAGPSDRG